MALSSAYGLLNARLTAEGYQDADATHYKPELMQCVLEINTDVCETIGEADRDLTEKIQIVQSATDALGLRLWWGATHPFSQWSDQRITPDERYLQLVSLLQEMARRLVTFGLHVHVGVDSGDKAVMICDRIMRHLPDAARALGEQPVLGRPRHGAPIAPLEDHGGPAHRRPAHADAQLERVRLAREPHGRHRVHQHDPRDLVGRAAAPQVRHRRSPHLRHAGQPRTTRWPSPRSSSAW